MTMDPTITLVLVIGSPIAALAATWGVIKYRVKKLEESHHRAQASAQEREEKWTDVWADQAQRLTVAVECMAKASAAIVEFDDRRGKDIERTGQIARQNRARVSSLEEFDREQVKRRLRDAGVDAEILNDVTGVHRTLTREVSASHET